MEPLTSGNSRCAVAGEPASPASAFPGSEPLLAAWTSWVDALSKLSNGQLPSVPALLTVWLHQLSRPETAITVAAELNLKLFQSTFAIWVEAAQRWCGMAPSSAGGEPASGGDKRFTAPEWHNNPV